MIGSFIQTNSGSIRAHLQPNGYVVEESGCWTWVGPKDRKGYGHAWRDGRSILAHRMTWIDARGPVAPSMELDHLCRNRACVRPDHLEPVTHAENVRRGDGITVRNAAKTHCPNGHPYDEANTCYSVIGRLCRACARGKARARRVKAMTGEERPT